MNSQCVCIQVTSETDIEEKFVFVDMQDIGGYEIVIVLKIQNVFR